MRKLILTATALLVGLSLQAQQSTMKVALLAPIDRAEEVTLGTEQLIMGALTSAIANTPGYEAYDRVNMESIFGEQQFQRTGNVSNDQIRQIGVASGAAYVLITEVSMLSNEVVINTKIVDVESFQVVQSAVETAPVSSKDIKAACNSLTYELLGTTSQKQASRTKKSTYTAPARQDAQPQRASTTKAEGYKNP